MSSHNPLSAPSSSGMLLQQPTPRTSTPSATATQTQTSIPPLLVSPTVRAPDGTLQLRGGPVSNRRVQWDEDVVDNEGLGRKSSKVCCIYHKPRAYDESSSSDDSSSSESDSDSEGEGRGKGGDGKDGHGHEHGEGCGHRHGGGQRKGRKPKPNAYEKMPKNRR